MGKRGKRRSNMTRRSDVVVENFRVTLPVLSAAASGSVALNPVNFGTRLAQLSDAYTEFRFLTLRAEFMPKSVVDCVLGYLAGTVGTGPTTTQAVSQLERSAYHFSPQTTMSALVLSRKDLIGEAINNWYKTGVGSDSDSQGEQQGTIYVASGSTDLNVHFIGTIEFCGTVDPASTPVFLRRVLRFREWGPALDMESKQKILQALELARLSISSSSSSNDCCASASASTPTGCIPSAGQRYPNCSCSGVMHS